MPSPVSQISKTSPSIRENNFDIVRLLLALIVVLFHCAVVSANPSLAILPRFAEGGLAVEGFFAISGFLIFASYERARSLEDYSIKRAARILPAYWLATAVCLLIAFSLGRFHVGKFLLANLTFLNFLHPNIPGVFQSNPVDAMDGALWTIKIEVAFYIMVPAIVWLCRRWNRDMVLWVLFACSLLFHAAFANHENIVKQLPGQLSYFMIGALVHYHLPFFMKNGKWIMLAAAFLYGLHIWTGWYSLRPAAISALTLGAALLLPVVKGPTRWGDFSYGTYVLHSPVIQVLIAIGLYRAHAWLAVLVTMIVVAVLAIFSWFVVEKPSLARAHARSRRLKPSYAPVQVH